MNDVPGCGDDEALRQLAENIDTGIATLEYLPPLRF